MPSEVFMLLFVMLLGCAQSVTDVWEDWDAAIYVDQAEVEDRCADMPTNAAPIILVTSWTMTASRPHFLYTTGRDNYTEDIDTCELTPPYGCQWNVEKGETIEVGPLYAEVDCATREAVSQLGLGGQVHGRTLDAVLFRGHLD